MILKTILKNILQAYLYQKDIYVYDHCRKKSQIKSGVTDKKNITRFQKKKNSSPCKDLNQIRACNKSLNPLPLSKLKCPTA